MGAAGVLARIVPAPGDTEPGPVGERGGASSRRLTPVTGRRIRMAHLYPYLLIAPTFLFLVAVFLGPVLYSLYLSTRQMQLFEFSTGGRFVGVANYLAAVRDPLVWNALTQTSVFVVGAVTLELTLGMAIALFLNQRLPGRRVLRAIALFPLMLTPVVLGITFRILFNYSYGIINYALGRVGVDPVVWLAATPWAMIAVIVTDVWNQTPFVTLLLLAGLQSIPEEYYEAARVDGAGAVLRSSTLLSPCSRPLCSWRSSGDSWRRFGCSTSSSS